MKAWVWFMYTKVGYNCHSNAILLNIWSENTTILVQSSIVGLDIVLNSIEFKKNSHKRYIDYLTQKVGARSKFI